eukprot:10451207-Lingulodinium_polyedra.AAC.1
MGEGDEAACPALRGHSPQDDLGGPFRHVAAEQKGMELNSIKLPAHGGDTACNRIFDSIIGPLRCQWLAICA